MTHQTERMIRYSRYNLFHLFYRNGLGFWDVTSRSHVSGCHFHPEGGHKPTVCTAKITQWTDSKADKHWWRQQRTKAATKLNHIFRLLSIWVVWNYNVVEIHRLSEERASLSSGIIPDCTASLSKAGNLHRQRSANFRSVIYSWLFFIITSVSMSERNSFYRSECECLKWHISQSGHSHSSPCFVMLTCSLSNCVFAKHMVTMFPGSCMGASIVNITTLYSTEATLCSMTINLH